MLEAAERADQLLDEGELAGAEMWHRILNAIERLPAQAPAITAISWRQRSSTVQIAGRC